MQNDFKIVNLPVNHNLFYFMLNFDWVLTRQNSVAEEKAYGKTEDNRSVCIYKCVIFL